MKIFYANLPLHLTFEINAAAILHNTALLAQMKYPAVSSQQTLNSSQTLDVSGKMQVSKEVRLLDDIYLEKLKDLSLPGDRLVVIGPDGKLKGGPPTESTPPGNGGGGYGSGGNASHKSCAGATFEWQNISGKADIYNCRLGNVGIGTTQPESNLHIQAGSPSILLKATAPETIEMRLTASNGAGRITSTHHLGIFIDADSDDTDELLTVYRNNPGTFSGPSLFTIYQNGTAELYGAFHACAVVVETLQGCDFVFEKDYALLPLTKRKELVLFNKRLLNIEPARQMEANGADLGKTTIGILQNVEEHELYLYDHDARIEALEKEIKEQKAAFEKTLAEQKKIIEEQQKLIKAMWKNDE